MPVTPITDEAFKYLDSLNYRAFTKLTEMLKSEGNTGNAEDGVRQSQIHEVNQMIKDFSHTLFIVSLESKHVKNDIYAYKLKMYEDKKENLNVLVRNLLLHLHDREIKETHSTRIAKYNDLTEEVTLSPETQEALKKEGEKMNEESLKQKILKKNKTITASLMSVQQLMSGTILQTELNIDSIDQQTKDLSSLNERVTDFEVLLKRSKQIVKFIEKQDRSDKNRIYLSFGFLLLCCAWILWRRVFKIPVKLFIWFMLRLFNVFSYFSGSSTLERQEKFDSSSSALESSITYSINKALTYTSLPSSIDSLSTTGSAAIAFDEL